MTEVLQVEQVTQHRSSPMMIELHAGHWIIGMAVFLSFDNQERHPFGLCRLLVEMIDFDNNNLVATVILANNSAGSLCHHFPLVYCGQIDCLIFSHDFLLANIHHPKDPDILSERANPTGLKRTASFPASYFLGILSSIIVANFAISIAISDIEQLRASTLVSTV